MVSDCEFSLSNLSESLCMTTSSFLVPVLSLCFRGLESSLAAWLFRGFRPGLIDDGVILLE